ncbi:solute carrier family 25 member 53 [Protopterus annectens]|uniref:solute carrier family 25 member 53 n=1 Tax=Protopterus annectens TaxID=7888 RepID=UPI001CF9721B|nr:solute carrier family 25 member 53 [Protopterus annectens]
MSEKPISETEDSRNHSRLLPTSHNENSLSQALPHSSSYAFGAVSGFLSTIVTFPIYKTIFRQQIHTSKIREAVNQLRLEGFVKFYRGLLPPLLSKTVQGTVLFGIHDSVFNWMSSGIPERHLVRNRCIAGFISGCVEAVLLVPFERVQNILQDSRKDTRFPNIQSICREFNSYSLEERIRSGYYRGFFPILLRNGMGSALYFTFKDPIQGTLSQWGLPSGFPAFVSGSMNGVLVCLILYPLSVLIANMQSQVGREMKGVRDSISFTWESREKKVTLLYRGGSLIILRSCLTWGLTTVIYELLKGNKNVDSIKCKA